MGQVFAWSLVQDATFLETDRQLASAFAAA